MRHNSQYAFFQTKKIISIGFKNGKYAGNILLSNSIFFHLLLILYSGVYVHFHYKNRRKNNFDQAFFFNFFNYIFKIPTCRSFFKNFIQNHNASIHTASTEFYCFLQRDMINIQTLFSYFALFWCYNNRKPISSRKINIL